MMSIIVVAEVGIKGELMKHVEQLAEAGINFMQCPYCYNPDKKIFTYGKLSIDLWELAKIRVSGAETYSIYCNNPKHPHKFEVRLTSGQEPWMSDKEITAILRTLQLRLKKEKQNVKGK